MAVQVQYELTIDFDDRTALQTLADGQYFLKVASAHDPRNAFHQAHIAIDQKLVESAVRLLTLPFQAVAPSASPDYWVTFRLPGGNPLASALQKIEPGQAYIADVAGGTGSIDPSPGWVDPEQIGFVNTKAATPVVYRKLAPTSGIPNPTPDVDKDQPLAKAPVYAPGNGILRLPKASTAIVAWFENDIPADPTDEDSIGYADQTRETNVKWKVDTAGVRKAKLTLDADFNLNQ